MPLHTPRSTRMVVWPLAMAAIVVFAALLLAFAGGGRAAAAADCKFVLGFQALHAMIPDTVGACLENEQHHPGKGVTLQRTTGGLLVWQKGTNHTAFTDGYRTWVHGPLGLQQRRNTEQLDWERDLEAMPNARTIAYVLAAIARYEQEGLAATVAYYNSDESIDGPLYVFLIDEHDTILVNPIFLHLIGTDVKDVVGSNGYELGKEIAKATEAGHWVEYLWPNPVTAVEEAKTAWVIRHDGLIFASGYYTTGAEAEEPAWRTADPREYTVEYVQRAIERYDREGLEAMAAYYNSVSSFQGQFYLFAMDANDIYFIHPLFPRLRGTDIKDVVGSDGYELGKEIAKATEAGHWIEYLWAHPVTLKEVPKIAYAIRHDGRIFASGYYPSIAMEMQPPR